MNHKQVSYIFIPLKDSVFEQGVQYKEFFVRLQTHADLDSDKVYKPFN